MSKTIAILTDERCSNILETGYYLAELARAWQDRGIRVLTTAGCHYVPADIAILHIDQTVVGNEYLDLAARYPVTINGTVKDISKSRFSRQLLRNNDIYDGPVIVKTDANYGGVIEHELAIRTGQAPDVPPDFERPWRKRSVLDSYNYPVFDHMNDVPRGVWKNDRLIVEKFLPERLDNGEFRYRCYLFFGEQEMGMWFSAPQSVIKGSTSTSRGVTENIPDLVREMRRSFGFDYGRFDYTEIDGEVNLFDMNKTPALGTLTLSLVPKSVTQAFANEIMGF